MTSSNKAPEHLRFAVLAVDVVLFSIRNDELVVRTIQVNRPPAYVHIPGFPGGLIDPAETAEQSAERLLRERGGINSKSVHMEQLYTFTSLDRDPRGRVVSVAYLALVPWETLSEEEQTNTSDAMWEKATALKKLAYDHDEILRMALERLRSRITYTTLIQKVLPREFTLTELEKTFGSILKKSLDKRNFRKKILKLKIVTPLRSKKKVGAFRPATLHRFASQTVSDIAAL